MEHQVLEDLQKILKNFTPGLSLFLDEKDFIIKTASDPGEVKESMKLRHKVYYEELLKTVSKSGLDFDRYDEFCDHLLVIEKNTSTLAGTYRLNVSTENDFYSSEEFNIRNILKLPGKKVELGRACVHPDYRRGKVLPLLVKGFLTYVSMAEIRYLFGCSSISAESREDFLHIWNLLVNHYRLPEDMDTPPVERQDCVLELHKDLQNYPFDYNKGRSLLPPLIVLYLKTGSLVSSFPFYDKKFNCFDFFTILDMEKANRKVINKLTSLHPSPFTLHDSHINPYHMFNHQGSWYIINVEGMFARAINNETAGIIEQIGTDGSLTLNSHMEEQLRKPGLLSEDGSRTPKVGKNIKEEETPVVNMCLFLTQSCNLKCIYCYGNGGEYGTGGDMEEKTAWQAVDWMVEQSGKINDLNIGFFGGEPFLRFPLMKSVVEYAKKRVSETGKNISFHITTNGTLLDDEKIAFIKEQKMSVMVSFDGTKELQDLQRPRANGKGSYELTVPKIKKLLEAMPDISGHAIIIGNTDPGIVKDSMKKIGFSNISTMIASGSLFVKESDKIKSARDTESLFREREEEAENWVNLIKNRDSEALKDLINRSVLGQALLSLFHNKKVNHACGAGRGLVAVSSSGNIYLCHRFVGRDEYKLGSIYEKKLKREEYQKSPLVENEVCSTCFAKYYCAGGCKHDNAASCGSISTPSEDMCRLRCRELELAATVICRLKSEDRVFLIDREIAPGNPCPFDF